MRTRTRPAVLLVALLLVGAVTGCDDVGGAASGDGTRGPTTTAGATAPGDDRGGADPSVDAAPSTAASPDAGAAPADDPTPGQPCEPGSHPDCSDATGTEGAPYRIIAGYADCLALHGPDEAYGLCTDLDGDDHAGYADAG
ncbi:hypothetical protein [Cellulomonas sp. Y8]|uniref:hypothetical protein n=1 Tax=Cellulomonas sp. Y8 TaxID=2591145 RepID=UPI0011CBA6A1|nr:hypothetical protein [Cellulomonas sp. Y8]